MKIKFVIINITIFLIFLADRVVKWLMVNQYQGDFFIIPKILKINFTQNQGISFGLGLNNSWAVVLDIIILLGLFYFLVRSYIRRQGILIWGLTLIIFGATSNLLDRLHHQAVIDYFSLWIWPVFNLADMMIVAGVVLIVIWLWRNKKGADSKILQPKADPPRAENSKS